MSVNCFWNSEPEDNCIWKPLICSLCSSDACGPGIMHIWTLSSLSRRDVICVAWRVQRLWSLGNGIPLRLSSREDLPELWSPTTTSCLMSEPIRYHTRIFDFRPYLRKRHMLANIQVTKLINPFEQDWVWQDGDIPADGCFFWNL